MCCVCFKVRAAMRRLLSPLLLAFLLSLRVVGAKDVELWQEQYDVRDHRAGGCS